MQQQFLINNTQGFSSHSSTLCLLVGADHLAYAIYDSSENELAALKWYRLPAMNAESLNGFISENQMLAGRFQRVAVAFDFDTNTLLPSERNIGDNSTLLHLQQSNPQDHIISEVIPGWNITNIYSLPYPLLNCVVTNFPSAALWHIQSVLIRNAQKNLPSGGLAINFSRNRFAVTATRNDQVLIARSFSYNTPDDVLYYLLKICEGFQLKQETVQLILSGWVDKNSGLYKTLYDYFLNLDFSCATWLQPGNIPLHYFTLLNQLLLCES